MAGEFGLACLVGNKGVAELYRKADVVFPKRLQKIKGLQTQLQLETATAKGVKKLHQHFRQCLRKRKSKPWPSETPAWMKEA